MGRTLTVEDCLAFETREREASNVATGAAREAHFVLAERWADEAWHLNELDDRSPPLSLSPCGVGSGRQLMS